VSSSISVGVIVGCVIGGIFLVIFVVLGYFGLKEYKKIRKCKRFSFKINIENSVLIFWE
jgi:Ca2+/Na+ antiporter